MNNVALVIIYNHNYEKNIERIEKIYVDRFDNIYHLMPFFRGKKNNVIPIYENSYYFQGFVTQFYNQINYKKFDHYFFLADDLLLNPKINQNNYQDFFAINNYKSFIPSFIDLSQKTYWTHIKKALNWNINKPGLEIQGFLPDFEIAKKLLSQNEINYLPINWRQLSYGKISIFESKNLIRITKRTIGYLVFKAKFIINIIYLLITRKINKLYLKYPMVGSYSDIFIVDSKSISKFSEYCGLFACTELFVEIAIPTSLVLSKAEISQELDTELCGGAIWDSDEINLILKQANYNLSSLMTNFPEDKLYLHPIKLSLLKE